MAAQNRPVVDLDLTAQRYAIGEDAAVAHHTIVSHMHISHQQHIAAYHGLSFSRRSPADRHTLADHRIVPYFGCRIFAFELEVLRYAGHHGGSMYLTVPAQPGSVHQYGPGADPATVAYDYVVGNIGERFYGNVRSELSLAGNVSQFANHACG